MSLTLLTTTIADISPKEVLEFIDDCDYVITDDRTYTDVHRYESYIIVVSDDEKYEHHNNSLPYVVKIAKTIGEAISYADGDIVILGNNALYELAIEAHTSLRVKIDDIVILRDTGDIVSVPTFSLVGITDHKVSRTWLQHQDTLLETIHLGHKHEEEQYLDLLREILYYGQKNIDRTEVGTLSLFGKSMTFDLRNGFPLLTTKFVPFEMIKKELLFFISGKTDTKILETQNVGIWKGNTSVEELRKKNLPWREGDMGPSYSHQWRHAGANYTGCDTDYTGQGVDQLRDLIEGLKNKPHDRRHIISAWNVKDISQMALPPCHCFAQFYVDGQYLDCLLYQRSADMFLGVPFNIASYALLTSIIGQLTGLTPRKLIHELGDCHVYLNHIQQVQQQLTRSPYPFPTLDVTTPLTDIDNIALNDLKLLNYKHHDKIAAVMAV